MVLGEALAINNFWSIRVFLIHAAPVTNFLDDGFCELEKFKFDQRVHSLNSRVDICTLKLDSYLFGILGSSAKMARESVNVLSYPA